MPCKAGDTLATRSESACALRGPQVDSPIIKQVVIRVEASGTTFDVDIKDDDTLTVREGATTTAYPQAGYESFSSWSVSFGSPTVLTVHREYSVTRRGGWVFKWRVSFAFGGSVVAWPTHTYNQNRVSWRRSENEPIWLWVNVPTALLAASGGTGLCHDWCDIKPTLPYNWCEGVADCLPVKVDDTVFSSSDVAALEAACGIASGASLRPNTCTNRPSPEVDCGYTRGGVNENTPVYKKWPKNKSIRNDRNSGGTGSKYNRDSWGSNTPWFTDMAQHKLDEATGTCGIGQYCTGSPPSVPGVHHACKNTNPGGAGGAVDDPDCEYDYEFRDSFHPGGSKFFPSQACWDFCSNYVHDADTSAKRCGVRNALWKGGEIHCGFIGGKHLWQRSRSNRVDGHHRRCHMFASSGHIETIGGEYGAFQFGQFKYGVAGSPYLTPGATHNIGPYDMFVMVRRTPLTRLFRSCLTFLLLALSSRRRTRAPSPTSNRAQLHQRTCAATRR